MSEMFGWILGTGEAVCVLLGLLSLGMQLDTHERLDAIRDRLTALTTHEDLVTTVAAAVAHTEAHITSIGALTSAHDTALQSTVREDGHA